MNRGAAIYAASGRKRQAGKVESSAWSRPCGEGNRMKYSELSGVLINWPSVRYWPGRYGEVGTLREKRNLANDDAFAWKMVGKVLIDSANGFRWRQVGWVPLLAFLVALGAVAFFLRPDQASQGWFGGLAQVLVTSVALVFWCPFFFAVACFQWRKYRKDESRSTVIALVSMCLHGAVTVCALVPVVWLALALLR